MATHSSFDLHTALGRYTIIPWPRDNRIGFNPLEILDDSGPISTTNWDPVMEGITRATIRACGARGTLVEPGMYSLAEDHLFERVLERLVVKSGGHVEEATHEEGQCASNREHSIHAVRRMMERVSFNDPLRHALEAGEAVCRRKGGVRAWDIALKTAQAEALDKLGQRALRMLQDARKLRAHDAARRARRALLGVAETMLPESPDPVAALLAWWEALPDAEPFG
jgi:hypothetical protein